MKYFHFIFISIFISLNISGQNKIVESKGDIAFYKATKKWFSAWKLVSKEIYHLTTKYNPSNLFFLTKNMSIRLLQSL